MPITFTCPHCEARMTVPDAVAGKRGKCSKCKGAVSVPAHTNGTAAPSAPLENLDEMAMSILGDEPKQEEKPTDFLEFNCPQCDEPLKLGLDLAGKKHPCPECRRIISVPMPKKKDPANWRDKGPSLPSAARRDTEPEPTDAWGTGKRTGPSEESLREAGVIKEKHKPATLLQRAYPYLLLSSPLVLLLVGGLWLWHWSGQLNEKRAYDFAMSMATPEKGAKLVGHDGLAALSAYSAEYQMKSGKSGSVNTAHSEFIKAVASIQKVSSLERNAFLLDLLPKILALGGSKDEVIAGDKKSMADIQKLLISTLRGIDGHPARMEGLRRLTALLVERKEDERVLTITSGLDFATDADRLEAQAVARLELLRAGNKALAAKGSDEVFGPFAPAGKTAAKGKAPPKRPEIRAAVVALALALEQTPPKAEKSWKEDEEIRIGKCAGKAMLGKADEARQEATRETKSDRERFKALVAIAAETGEAADVNAALDALAAVTRTPDLDWPAIRLFGLAQKAKLIDDRLDAAANAVPDGLKGWAQLWMLRSRLAGSRTAEGLDVLEQKFPARSLAEKVARLELCRHNTLRSSGWAKNVQKWDDGPKAFGALGVALGLQGG